VLDRSSHIAAVSGLGIGRFHSSVATTGNVQLQAGIRDSCCLHAMEFRNIRVIQMYVPVKLVHMAT